MFVCGTRIRTNVEKVGPGVSTVSKSSRESARDHRTSRPVAPGPNHEAARMGPGAHSCGMGNAVFPFSHFPAFGILKLGLSPDHQLKRLGVRLPFSIGLGFIAIFYQQTPEPHSYSLSI